MIRARQVRVIDEAGNQLGIMSPPDAIREAKQNLKSPEDLEDGELG